MDTSKIYKNPYHRALGYTGKIPHAHAFLRGRGKENGLFYVIVRIKKPED